MEYLEAALLTIESFWLLFILAMLTLIVIACSGKLYFALKYPNDSTPCGNEVDNELQEGE